MQSYVDEERYLETLVPSRGAEVMDRTQMILHLPLAVYIQCRDEI